jgi:D-amino-acid dehydrogenase
MQSNSMDVVVLGAGIIGVTTAFYLAREGHRVTVIDRRSGPGLETSFANGSQLAGGGAGPWSTPNVPRDLWRWLGREDAPLLLRLSATPGLWRWGPEFLRNCTPERWRENARVITSLAILSFAEFKALTAEHVFDFDSVKRGILAIHRSQESLDRAAAGLAASNALGMRKIALDREQAIAIEESLRPIEHEIAGAIYSPDDETGDCLKFTQALAAIAEKSGVRFLFDADLRSLRSDGRRVTGIDIKNGASSQIRADCYIMCLGSESMRIARRLGIYLPIYPVKGYSATVSVAGWNGAPTASLVDDKRKMGFSRLGDRLRMAGTAEFAGFDPSLNRIRGGLLMAGLYEMFPSFPREREAVQWAGLRPMTPNGRPLLGQTKLENLFVNSGHGTLGWTLACGSARVMADILARRSPPVSVAAFAPTPLH